MKLLTFFFVFTQTFSVAQNASDETKVTFYESSVSETVKVNAKPAEGYASFQRKLERILSEADTIGKRFEVPLDNIGFIVGRSGKVDSAWVMFYNRPLHRKVIEELKKISWTPAQENGIWVSSRQELYVTVYLTKAALKNHGCWPSFVERILPWTH